MAAKPGAYARYAAQVDNRIGRVGRHAAVGVVGGGVAGAAGHFGVGGLELSPATVGVGVAVGVAASVAADLVLLDEDEYLAAQAANVNKRAEALARDIEKRSPKEQENIKSMLLAM